MKEVRWLCGMEALKQLKQKIEAKTEETFESTVRKKNVKS